MSLHIRLSAVYQFMVTIITLRLSRKYMSMAFYGINLLACTSQHLEFLNYKPTCTTTSRWALTYDMVRKALAYLKSTCGALPSPGRQPHPFFL